MNLTIDQIEKLAPKATAFNAAKKLSNITKWDFCNQSERSIWGAVKGSAKNPYITLVDLNNLAYKCSCPSRQFPCKHALALLIVYANENYTFPEVVEPDYVAEWIDKRQARLEKVDKEEKELSEEEKQKRKQGKDKREKDRFQLVDEGVKELMQWLKDLIRIGLLELPNKTPSYFEQVAARMIDAKAPGLAAWIRAFNEFDYHGSDNWHDEVTSHIGKLYLLLKGYQNRANLSIETQETLKGLIGWSYKVKDLENDPKTNVQADDWLILGSLHEKLSDDLAVHRSWLHGLESGKSAVIITYESKYNVDHKAKLLDGAVIQAELGFYPNAILHRAFIKNQYGTSNTIQKKPNFSETWIDIHQQDVEKMKSNPWHRDQSYLIRNVRLLGNDMDWVICDSEKNIQRIVTDFSTESMMKTLLICNNTPTHLACVKRSNRYLPLGIFQEGKYLVI